MSNPLLVLIQGVDSAAERQKYCLEYLRKYPQSEEAVPVRLCLADVYVQQGLATEGEDPLTFFLKARKELRELVRIDSPYQAQGTDFLRNINIALGRLYCEKAARESSLEHQFWFYLLAAVCSPQVAARFRYIPESLPCRGVEDTFILPLAKKLAREVQDRGFCEPLFSRLYNSRLQHAPAIYYYVGCFLLKEGKYAIAEEALNTALQQCAVLLDYPEWSEQARFTHKKIVDGIVLTYKRMVPETNDPTMNDHLLASCDKILKLNSNEPEACLLMARWNLLSCQWDKAASFYERISPESEGLSPDDFLAMQFLSHRAGKSVTPLSRSQQEEFDGTVEDFLLTYLTAKENRQLKSPRRRRKALGFDLLEIKPGENGLLAILQDDLREALGMK